MLAGLQAFDRLLLVLVARGANDHDVDFGIGNRLVE
jgi:hypothetical protein